MLSLEDLKFNFIQVQSAIVFAVLLFIPLKSTKHEAKEQMHLLHVFAHDSMYLVSCV